MNQCTKQTQRMKCKGYDLQHTHNTQYTCHKKFAECNLERKYFCNIVKYTQICIIFSFLI